MNNLPKAVTEFLHRPVDRKSNALPVAPPRHKCSPNVRILTKSSPSNAGNHQWGLLRCSLLRWVLLRFWVHYCHSWGRTGRFVESANSACVRQAFDSLLSVTERWPSTPNDQASRSHRDLLGASELRNVAPYLRRRLCETQRTHNRGLLARRQRYESRRESFDTRHWSSARHYVEYRTVQSCFPCSTFGTPVQTSPNARPRPDQGSTRYCRPTWQLCNKRNDLWGDLAYFKMAWNAIGQSLLIIFIFIHRNSR